MTHKIGRAGRCVAGAILLAVLGGGPADAQPEVPLDRRQGDGVTAVQSARTVSYDIDVTLDPASRSLTGHETITWRNTGAIAAYSIRLHLFWNAFRNTDSTWMRQRRLSGDRAFGLRPEQDFGFTEITGLEVLGPGGQATENLLPAFRYISPSDQNNRDRSLAAAQLTTAIQPGETLRLAVRWRARFPKNFDRTGAIGNFFLAAQWFPKLGVFEPGGWTSHQFFANGGPHAEFGRYDVRITVPSGWMVGATGTQQSTESAATNTTHRFVQDDVNDFAWTTSPDFVERRQRFEHPGIPGVEMRLLLQPEHAGQAERHFAATAAALRYYGEWFGRYPYGHITIVDPPFQSASEGRAYPTLFTTGSHWLEPARGGLEARVIAGAGRQFWSSLVAANAVDHDWLVAGLNRYAQSRVQSVAFDDHDLVQWFLGRLWPWRYADIPLRRATDLNGMEGYRRDGDRDALGTPSRLMWPGTDQAMAADKAALMLHTLERKLGWETMRRVMATYFDRWRFRHPWPEDFIAVATEVSGQDLTGFFDQVYRSSNRFDYAIERFESEPLSSRGLVDGPGGLTFGEQAEAGVYRTTVVARRLEAGQFPVDILVTFANGEQVREAWDGLARWQAFHFDRPVPAVSVAVDPERVLLLDTNYTNNSRLLEPATGPAARKWSLRWMVWLQDLLMTYAFFV